MASPLATAAVASTQPAITAPTISGSPLTAIQAGDEYFFQARAQQVTPAAFKFAIQNKPIWASFDSSTGTLSGTPTTNNLGTSSNIRISLSAGQQSASLQSFSITVSAPPAAAAKAALRIAGQPLTAINVNSTYVFLPTASDTRGAALKFAIQNKPSWSLFNASTGELSGNPNSASVGTYRDIVISASDGLMTAALPAFQISVSEFSSGSVTLSWLPPTANTNGTTLTNLAGFKIYYGTNPSALNQSLKVTNPGISRFVIGNLSTATWFFSVVSYNSVNIESPFSKVVSKHITT